MFFIVFISFVTNFIYNFKKFGFTFLHEWLEI